MSEDSRQQRIRRDLAAAYRLMAMDGMDDGISTHISARVAPGRFLLNAFGLRFEEITADSLVTVDEHGQVLDGVWQSIQETVGRKGPEQAHLEHTNFLALLQQPFDRLVGAFGAGSHKDNHTVSVGVADIIKQPVLTAGNTGKPVHHGFQLVRKCLIERVDGLPGLAE